MKIWRSYRLLDLIAKDIQLAPSLGHFCDLNLNIIQVEVVLTPKRKDKMARPIGCCVTRGIRKRRVG